MLQALRDKTTGTITYIILGLIVLAMVAYVFPSFFGNSALEPVIRVGKLEVTPAEWQDVFNNEVQRDPSLASGNNKLKKLELAQRVADQKLLEVVAAEAGISLSSARLRSEIENFGGEVFKLDGKFSEGLYMQRLVGAGLTPARFEQDLSRDLQTRTIPEALGNTLPVTDREVDRFVSLRDQTRDLRYLSFALTDVPAPAALDDAGLRTFYDANNNDFMSEEQLNIEYLWVKNADINFATPDEDDLKTIYEQRKDSFINSERRMASHILVEVATDADAEAQKKGLAKAEALLKRIRAGEDFAAVAKAESDDAGSKEESGDLGWLEKGVTEAAFESAMFAMKTGDISEPVKTDQGYHVIQLREIQPEAKKTFEEVRAELDSALAKERRDQAYNELLTRLGSDLQSDPYQLSGPAKNVAIPLVESGLVNRNALPAPLNTPEVALALSKETVLVRGAVSDRIRVGENDSLWVRIVERKQSAVRPFDEVKADLVTKATANAHELALKAKAAAWLKQAQGAGNLDALAKESNKIIETKAAVGRNVMDTPGPIVRDAFKANRPKDGKPTLGMVKISPVEFALFEVSKVTEGDLSKLDAAARDAVRAQLRGSNSFAEQESFRNTLRQLYDIKIYEDRL